MFFGAGGNCVQFAFTGSFLPNNVEIGTVTSSDEEYFYVKCELTEFEFDIIGGNTSTAKLILGGGGGRSNVFNFNPLDISDSSAGGGGAGEVIIQDIDLSPGRYFASASAGGASGSYGQSISDGDDSIFVIGYDKPLAEQQTITARGGLQNDGQDAGASGNGFTGGDGVGSGTISAGGGGGGNTVAGQDAYNTPGVGNARTGGNGGTGSVVPPPFDNVIGFNVIGEGGPGGSYSGYNGSYPSGAPNAYSNGAGGTSGWLGQNGERGVFALFIPISNCNTGSAQSDNFEAIGGTTGTFVTESVQYKYHLFTDTVSPVGERTNIFQVTQGFTDEGRVMMIGGGAGSSVSASSQGQEGYLGGGAGAGGLVVENDVSLFGLNTVVLGYGGGGGVWPTQGSTGGDTIFDANEFGLFLKKRGYGGGAGSSTAQAQDSNGSGGGGGAVNGASAKGLHLSGPHNNIGNDGADGNYPHYGSGGGGAGGTGSQGNNNNDTGSAGEGGDGYDISQGFWSFLTGSFTTGFVGHGGGGGVRFIPGFATESAYYTQEANSGGGANPYYLNSGSDGFVAIVYPISGSTSNSPA